MAVRFDAASDRIAYTGGAPAPSAGFTLTAWALVAVDLNDFQTIARLYNGGTAANLATSSDGLGGPNYFTAGGSINASTGFVVGEWRKVAFSCTGTNGKLYVATVGGATEVDTGTVSGAASPTAIALGGRAVSDSSEWLNGRLAHVRVWDTELAQSEIEAEWASATPVHTADLWADWPLATHADLTDHSGNGRHLSAGSTSTTTEDGPPLSADFELALDPAGETDTAQPFAATKTRVLDPAAETTTAQLLGRTKALTLGPAGEVETVQPLGRHKALALGTAYDVATTQPLGATKTRALGVAAETTTALGFGSPVEPGEPDMQLKAIVAKVTSVVQALGVFETVNGGALNHVPGAGLRASVWPGRITSPPGSSGLASTSIVLPMLVRIYGRVNSFPVDEIDEDMLDAADKVCDAYIGSFTLGATVRGIDIRGRFGQPMTIEPGYLDVQEGTCRVMTLTLPLIINDAWEEVA